MRLHCADEIKSINQPYPPSLPSTTIQAFVPTTTAFSGARVALPTSTSATTAPRMAADFGVFEAAQTEFADEFPEYSKYGWGPTAKAERWNGRHAMFGWAAIIATGYCQAHNLIPNADVALDPKVCVTCLFLTTVTFNNKTLNLPHYSSTHSTNHTACVLVERGYI